MSENELEVGNALLYDIKSIGVIISCLNDNYKDAAEERLYDIVFKYKDIFIPALLDLRKSLENKFKEL